VRVGQNRRRTYLYVPLLVLGAAMFLLAFPALNGAAVAGALLLVAGAGGFVLEADGRR
jgi:hypothetical protein